MKEKIIGRRSFLKYTAAVTAGTSLLGESRLAEGRQRGAKLRKGAPTAHVAQGTV